MRWIDGEDREKGRVLEHRYRQSGIVKRARNAWLSKRKQIQSVHIVLELCCMLAFLYKIYTLLYDIRKGPPLSVLRPFGFQGIFSRSHRR